MADLVLVAILVAFIALCVAYVAWCDRIISGDPGAADSAAQHDAETVLAAEVTA
jgi:hypothetical protein